jgi:hypothetical protein
MKLGEALVKEALITRQQLNQALERQVIFGGRIGTNLIELRFLSEEELTKFLSRYLRVPAVTQEMINSVPDEVINSVSKELVEKYKFLPFKKERNRLHTAMLNPKEVKEIDELRFVTGYEIIPHAITELKLLHALERYYGIKRNIRYVSLIDRFNPETKVEESSIDKIKLAFTEVKDTEEIAGILINEAYKLASRVAFLTVKNEKIMGWKARGLEIENFVTTDKESSIFSEVLRTTNIYRGPVLDIKGNKPFIKIISGTPQDALVLPVKIRDRIVALLYVDNGNISVLNANVGFLSMLVSMAAIAFEILILKKRILDFGYSDNKITTS